MCVGKVAALEESKKESCVIELLIEGSIEGGSMTQHCKVQLPRGLPPPKTQNEGKH